MCLRDDNSFSDMSSPAATMGASLSHDDLKNIPFSQVFFSVPCWICVQWVKSFIVVFFSSIFLQAMCKEVREILKPTSPGGINKSIKMSQFSFDIAKGTTLRTKVNRMINVSPSNRVLTVDTIVS